MTRGQLKVGAGCAVIDIQASLFPIEKYSGIHDDLHVRALLIDNGEDRAAIMVAELTGLYQTVSDHLRKIISREGDVPFHNTMICASHTFTAPHPKLKGEEGGSEHPSHHKETASKNDMFLEALTEAVVASVQQAKARMRSARIGFGQGECHVNVNRDVLTPKGWWKGSNPEGLSDKTLSVIRFEGLDGRPVALLMNYPVPSSVISKCGERLISADLAGAAARNVEERYGEDLVALWSTGAAGDQAPILRADSELIDDEGNVNVVDTGQSGYLLAEILGETLACEVVAISESIVECIGDASIKTVNTTISWLGQETVKEHHRIKPSRDYRFVETGPTDLPFSIMLLGDVAIVAVQVSLNCKTALQIKETSPFEKTLIVTSANGGAKYLPDAESFDKITYESMNSVYAKGGAEFLRDEVVRALHQAVHV